MPLGLYVHIPFCKKKCSYCAFVSHEGREDLVVSYLAALKKEAQGSQGSVLDTVYIGGGTPTHLQAQELESLFSTVSQNYRLSCDCEWTIEANPATFDLEKARLVRELGANRVSLGVQSFDNRNLKWLGRPHTGQEAQAAFEILRKAGFKNISLDLMYGLPHETQGAIQQELAHVQKLSPEHVSIYALSIEENSEFWRQGVVLPSGEEEAGFFPYVSRRLPQLGWRHYEVSNFAVAGFECRHNLNYWRGGNYIGLGVGAHSHSDGRRWWNTSDMQEYIRLASESGMAVGAEETLSLEDRLMERLLFGLRILEEVDLRALESGLGVKLPQEKREILGSLAQDGMLTWSDEKIVLSFKGLLVLDEICARLI